ncbi:hypothetical protein N7539_004514 [Penicillium diatomitis]|uniref:PNPLA domain-containing protein n=1 Tax=Penicillium diatomitis TaxID=2819901 RepID=A0A9W9XDY8_9EURO|nr:uncharacterized protein N7539_004514 [Penicillium diatomitis]KAJ5489624.1 hypothetical protein N7539_004514 [Penicillium diatomitis]
MFGLWAVISGVFGLILDVVQFWNHKVFSWWRSKSPKKRLVHALATAQSYEQWEEAAFELDELLSKDMWRQNPASRHYDYRLILGRLEALMNARESEDILTLVNLLRSGLVRNLGNITSTKLFTHAYAGTKLLIDDYITQVALSIQYVASLQPLPMQTSGFTSQAKLELLHDTRQAFGRTTLLLQGGSAFGVCHLGVVKALHLQGLLPRIITGTATGAMIAALVGIRTESELLAMVDGNTVDLSAFDERRKKHARESWVWTGVRRMTRLLLKGHLYDMDLLEECVRANVGDLTFEEAYARSKRILNITIATAGKTGTPNLLNYLTAPNVLIWSAAAASNASAVSSMSTGTPVTIYCKDETGSIVPWPHTQDATFHPWNQVHYHDSESPLTRIAELFNVNHFIVSQARPFLVPFLRSDLNLLDRRQTGWSNITRSLTRLALAELRHRLRQLDYLGFLPGSCSRLLIGETIPGPNLTLVPDLSVRDFLRIFQQPTRARVSEWILKGERGVWPAISALKVREAIEIELDRGYQLVRRRRPSDVSVNAHTNTRSFPGKASGSEEMMRQRRRGSGNENEPEHERENGAGG